MIWMNYLKILSAEIKLPLTVRNGIRVHGRNKAQGVGWMEAPRGALGHWIDIEDGKTKNYQAVVPTTWNASPRDTIVKLVPMKQHLKVLRY